MMGMAVAALALALADESVDPAACEYGFVQEFPAREGGLVSRVFDFGVE